MNILYLADPNSTHDLKWISYFSQNKIAKAFIIYRSLHSTNPKIENNEFIKVVHSIPDFSIFKFYRTLGAAYTIKQIVKKEKIDLLHILYAEPNALWTLLKWYFSIPVIITCRGTDVLKTIPFTFQNKNWINFFVAPAYKRAFRAADFVTGTSQKQLDSVQNFSLRNWKTAVIMTGVEINNLKKDTSSHFPLAGSKPFILFPRFIKPLYNHEFCLEAIALLPQGVKHKYTMVFLTKNHYEADLKYQAFLEERMHSMIDVEFDFLPEVSQQAMFELYKRASLVVMTPLSDGSPVSAMEAIACGAKVILGPLPYEEKVFNPWAFQLKSWDERELTDLMLHCLSSDSKADVSDFHQLVNTNNEMAKVLKIYGTLLKRETSVPVGEHKRPHFIQCTKCILDSGDDPEITFDAQGICSYCRAYESKESEFVRTGESGKLELNKIVDKIKQAGKSKRYDCIIGLSGGVDSTYLALLAKQLGLRPLAVHFDNGWNSELAVSNIENIVTRLGFDLHTFVIDWEEFRDLQLAFLKASVVDIEVVTDHAIFASLFKLALDNNVGYILSGTNYVTESILPASWIHDKRDHTHIKAIHQLFGKVPLKRYPLFTSMLKFRIMWKGIQSVSLLDFVLYEKAEVKKVIARELDWRDYGGKHYESVFTRFYQGYILPEKFGIDKRKAHLSNLINSKQITREQALEEVKTSAYPEDLKRKDFDFVLKKLGLSATDFEKIMKTPVKKHTDYPVDENIYKRYPILNLAAPVWKLIKKMRKV